MRKVHDWYPAWAGCMLVCGVTMAVVSTISLVINRSPLWRNWNWAGVALGAACLIFAARGLIARRSDRELARLRKQLIAAAASRTGTGTWLNRDEHLVLIAVHIRWVPGSWVVIRIDEELFPEIDALETAPGQALAIMFEGFIVEPTSPAVVRRDAYGFVTRTADGRVQGSRLPRSRSRVAGAWHNWRVSSRTGLGSSVASAAEVRELLGQLQGAEPMPQPA